MKVHIGCGSVYLQGYLNVDLPGPKTHLAKDRPDLVSKWITTDDHYYAKHQDKNQNTLRSGPLDQDYVCDAFGSFYNIPAAAYDVEELLARHVFEHMSMTEAHKALDEVDHKMMPGGVLRLDVPDHEGTLKKYKETGDEFYIRHLLGPRRNEFGYHCMSYTKDTLKKLVEEHGFVYDGEEENVHFYPAFCLRFKKPGSRPSWQYASEFIKIEKDWKVLEIGPGRNPFPRANHYVDCDSEVIRFLPDNDLQGKTLHNMDSGRLPFGAKEFDYVFCSHIVEHVADVDAVCKEISRVGKRGIIIVPSLFKDFMFNWEEGDHKWWFIPTEDKTLTAFPLNYQFRSVTADSNFSGAMARLFRTGPNRYDAEQRFLRKWFYNREKHLDVIHPWEGEINLRVVR